MFLEKAQDLGLIVLLTQTVSVTSAFTAVAVLFFIRLPRGYALVTSAVNMLSFSGYAIDSSKRLFPLFWMNFFQRLRIIVSQSITSLGIVIGSGIFFLVNSLLLCLLTDLIAFQNGKKELFSKKSDELSSLFVKFPNSRIVDLSYNLISKAGAKNFIITQKSNSSGEGIESLDFSSSSIDFENILPIIRYAATPSLQFLDISRISAFHFKKELDEILQDCSSLQVLKMRYCNLYDSDIKSIFESVKSLENLKHLDVSGNHLGKNLDSINSKKSLLSEDLPSPELQLLLDIFFTFPSLQELILNHYFLIDPKLCDVIMESVKEAKRWRTSYLDEIS
jgi:hypothetical protein